MRIANASMLGLCAGNIAVSLIVKRPELIIMSVGIIIYWSILKILEIAGAKDE